MKLLRGANLIMLASSMGWFVDSITINLFTVSTPQLAHQFRLTAATIGLIGTLFLAGYSFGTLFGGIYADYVGRRKALGVSVIGYSVFGALTGLSTTVGFLGIMRFLTGLGGGAEYPAGSTYVAESAPQKRRGAWVGIMNSVYGLGLFAAGAILAISGNWRIAFFTVLVLGGLVYWLRYVAQESNRYQQMRSDLEQGKARRSRFTVADLVDPRQRGATIRVSLMWIGYWVTWWGWSIFVPTYMVKYTHLPVTAVGGTMALYGFAGFVFQIVAGLLVEAIGRRWAITVITLGGMISVWVWLGLGAAPLAHWMGALGFGLVLAIPSAMLPYSTEQFPTTIRGTGQSAAIGIGRLVSIPMPLIAGLLVAHVGIPTEWKFWMAVPILILIGVWSGPETRGKKLLEDLSDLPARARSSRGAAVEEPGS